MEAGLGGEEAVRAAFGACEHLCRKCMDMDFIDFESVARAKVEEKELRVSGERYRVLVLPAMRAVRWSTIQKALEFRRAGGLVFAIGALPEASDRAGRDDAELNAAVKGLFGDGQYVLKSPADLPDAVAKALTRDFAPARGPASFMHRCLGARDLYMVYGLAQGEECTFRATGAVELWDPWTGETRPLSVLDQNAETTRLRMPLSEQEAQLIVFCPGQAVKDDGGAVPALADVEVEGEWACEYKPTMDNRWGDFRWPAFEGFIGPEARKFHYCEETAAKPGWEKPEVDESKWPRVTYAYGPQFMQLGPLPPEADVAALETKLLAARTAQAGARESVGGKEYEKHSHKTLESKSYE